MPRVCTVCTHPERAKIDAALAHGVGSRRRIAAQYSLAETSLRRHERRDLAPDLIEAVRAKVSENGTSNDLVARVTKMVDRLERMAGQCEDHGAAKDMLAVARELRPYHELYGRANGQLQSDRVTALFISLGVRDEEEVKQRLEMTRIGDPGPMDMIEEGCALIEMALARDGALWDKVQRRLQGFSHAEEVNGNGHALVNGG